MEGGYEVKTLPKVEVGTLCSFYMVALEFSVVDSSGVPCDSINIILSTKSANRLS